MDKSNPHLKAAFMEIVENQINDNEPPETRQTLDRLIARGISEEDARIYIGQAVCVEIWGVMSKAQEFDQERFLRNLKNLPEDPQE